MRRCSQRRLRELDDRADRELERLITKRHDPRDGDALLEPSYAESVRRFNARQQEALREQWRAFHRDMSRLHSQLADEHASKAAKLEEETSTKQNGKVTYG
jgi:hypothetical protein